MFAVCGSSTKHKLNTTLKLCDISSMQGAINRSLMSIEYNKIPLDSYL